MGITAAIIGGGAILGGALISGGAAISGANAQAGAARDASSLQAQQFQQTRQDLAPWLQTGTTALNALSKYTGLGPSGFDPTAPGVAPFDLSKFTASPSYQFNLQQGQLAIDKAANARSPGNYYAPQTLQDIASFSQGLASNEFTNAYNRYTQDQSNVWNRLSALSGSGQNAAAGIGGFAANAASNIGALNTDAAAAQAAGTMGAANAGNVALNSIANVALQQQALQRAQQSNYFNTPAGNSWWNQQQDPAAWTVG